MNVQSVCVSSDWQREDVVCSAEEEMSAGDKHESADNVPAAAPAPSHAAHTLTAGCDLQRNNANTAKQD